MREAATPCAVCAHPIAMPEGCWADEDELGKLVCYQRGFERLRARIAELERFAFNMRGGDDRKIDDANRERLPMSSPEERAKLIAALAVVNEIEARKRERKP